LKTYSEPIQNLPKTNKTLFKTSFNCFFLFKTRELRNAFIEETKGMMKAERMDIYARYQQMEA
jgi:hypothetical protein